MVLILKKIDFITTNFGYTKSNAPSWYVHWCDLWTVGGSISKIFKSRFKIDWNGFNSSLPEQNGRFFADDIFKCIFMNEKFDFLFKFH